MSNNDENWDKCTSLHWEHINDWPIKDSSSPSENQHISYTHRNHSQRAGATGDLNTTEQLTTRCQLLWLRGPTTLIHSCIHPLQQTKIYWTPNMSQAMLLSSTPSLLSFARFLHMDVLQVPTAVLTQNQALRSQCTLDSYGHSSLMPSICYQKVSSRRWDLHLMHLWVLQSTASKDPGNTGFL